MRGAALLALAAAGVGCAPAAERRPASPTTPGPAGTLTVELQDALPWPYEVRRAVVAVDGRRLPAGRDGLIRTVLPAGQHTVYVLWVVHYPCHPFADDEARILAAMYLETSSARAAHLRARLEPGPFLSDRPIAIRFEEIGTVSDADHLAAMARHPRLAGAPTMPLDCSRLTGKQARRCWFEARMRAALRRGDVATAWCAANALDEIDLRRPDDPDRMDLADSAWMQCITPGCYFPPDRRIDLPECSPLDDEEPLFPLRQ